MYASTNALRILARSAVLPQMGSVRCMSTSGLKGFSEHEKAAEDMYFTKEDQRNFNKLMEKIKKQSDQADTHAAAGVRAAELSALKPIVDKYKISQDDIDKIMAWKHTNY
mmetsp:Transcript_15082/g.40777  ORF Transcript_15082/g.40777 Transcript_15082/m.40777 type:complete len:110 (+) Transcript_15082:86-415(+)|eukprot:CAMPEP_0202340408 /NCGR_PEP_ID=MMETSP1126-20121109/1861_1 /ASSEMBLY_ACC=CAM_ASM_000457 /TAXON_ID=3047 /ORGANISM="Dunaliella tertiolecta, Strain CCMP1320" /LENGTH=109 /DNA_ID=CAMNT_0048931111 /DNA_START=64 /DNA_END=393 /DNA_ORIENTATION=-